MGRPGRKEKKNIMAQAAKKSASKYTQAMEARMREEAPFLARVIADLEAGRVNEWDYGSSPMSFDGSYSLFSADFDRVYCRGNPSDTWHISAFFDIFTMAFPVTELRRGNMPVPLTRGERKRLRKAANAAIKVIEADWQARKQRTRD